VLLGSLDLLLVVLELVEEITGETGAWAPVWIHLDSSAGLHTKDTILAIRRAGDNDASPSAVRSGCTSTGADDGALASVLSLDICDSLSGVAVGD
jgi:hypothetical protein